MQSCMLRKRTGLGQGNNCKPDTQHSSYIPKRFVWDQKYLFTVKFLKKQSHLQVFGCLLSISHTIYTVSTQYLHSIYTVSTYYLYIIYTPTSLLLGAGGLSSGRGSLASDCGGGAGRVFIQQPPPLPVQYSTVQYSTVKYSTVKYSTIQ